MCCHMSVMLIDSLFAENEIPISAKDRILIKALISPSTHPEVVGEYRKQQREFLFEIVANESNGIDVDKWYGAVGAFVSLPLCL